MTSALGSLSASLLCLAAWGEVAVGATLPNVDISPIALSVKEDAGAAVFAVTLSAASTRPVTVTYKVGPGNTNEAGTVDADFKSYIGKLTIAAGQTSGRIQVPIVDDANGEDTERFRVAMTSATDATFVANAYAAHGYILDDDSTAGGGADPRKLSIAPAGPYTYLDDVDPPFALATRQISGLALGKIGYPRIGLADSPVSQAPEQLTKYRFIAAQNVKKLAKVQALNPDVIFLRLLSPSAYQPSTDMGMPFEGTGPATEEKNVYAGHWLYKAGTPLTTGIDAGDTTLRVKDASRVTPGTYIVVYDAPAGSFRNAEHLFIKDVNRSTNTLTVGKRGYKSTARAHGAGSIVAEHVTGEGRYFPAENWVYNQSTASPRDANGKTLGQVMASWLGHYYNRTRSGSLIGVRVDGIQFDTDRYFLGSSKSADVDNDLVGDDGVDASGFNMWGEGIDRYYTFLRQALPDDMLMVGGGTGARGWQNLNGTQWEGFPVDGSSFAVKPDYRGLDAHLANFGFHIRHHEFGPSLTQALNKSPTKLYPKMNDRADPNDPKPTSNAPFRFSFGLALLDDGFYGQPGSEAHPDVWWDEYAVDVVPGSPSFGHAIATNPNNEARIRAHLGWLGLPLGERVRVYSPTTFARTQSLMSNGSFESGVNGWDGENVRLSADATTANTPDGSVALLASRPNSSSTSPSGAQILGPTVNLVKGEDYTLTFSVKSSEPRQMSVGVGSASVTQSFLVPTEWVRRVISFTANATGPQRVKFQVGREETQVWLDAVHVFKGNANVFQRDFEHGRVVVNATPQARTVDLGGTFQRIKGTGQDPLNDGATVQRVTLAPYDAAILVRP